jgi:hypothetical protein
MYLLFFNPMYHYKMMVDMSRLHFSYVGCDGVYFVMKDVFVSLVYCSLLMNVHSYT